MAWNKQNYRVVIDVSFNISNEDLEKYSKSDGFGRIDKIGTIKNLRDVFRFDGPDGTSLTIGLRDAKEIVEDWMQVKGY